MSNSNIKHNGGGDAHYPMVKLFPSVITMLGLCSGLTSIRCTFMGHWEHAVIFVMIAAFIDGIDGRIARLLNSATGFGAQLDSFADLLSFGVAPAFLLYFWTLRNMRAIGWMLVMVFVVCMSIRLARFNVALYEEEEREEWKKSFFCGVPAPMGALLSLAPIMLTFCCSSDFQWISAKMSNKNVVAVYSLLVSLLCVSNLPTVSTKLYLIPKKWSYVFMTLLGILMILAITHPWVTFPIMGMLYFISIPIGGAYYLYVDTMSKKYRREIEEVETPRPSEDNDIPNDPH